MRRPRVRPRLWWLMLAVVVIAGLVTPEAGILPEMSRRWNACKAAAYRQDQSAAMSARMADRARSPTEAALLRAKADSHRGMSRFNRRSFFNPFSRCVLGEDVY
jgi:hypothetical protein